MRTESVHLENSKRLTNPRINDVLSRLDDLRGMQDGWYEGEGVAPSDAGLDWLSTTFERHYPDDAPMPYTYPTFEGGISMEWSVENNEAMLEINIDAHSAEWFWLDLDSDDECEKTINMDAIEDWQWLASEIRSKLTTDSA